MTIEQYTAKLESFKANINTEVDKILVKNSNIITGMLKLRLYNYGIDGNYELIGEYSEKTKITKKANNQKTNFITLRDSGRFYAGMFLESKNGKYFIDSKDYKTNVLVETYGEPILDLTYKQQNDIIENIINPELEKLFSNVLGEIAFSLKL